MVQVHPYINYKGNCEEAFNFYKSIFGGEFTYVGRFKEMPNSESLPPQDADRIMHISLPLGNGTMLMGSDVTSEMEDRYVSGTNITLSITPDSEEEARRVFEALSQGGSVSMPQERTFWGSLFGMLTDKYGINWMVDYQLDKNTE